MVMVPSRNQKRSGAIAAEGPPDASACALRSCWRPPESGSDEYRDFKNRSASGNQRRSKSTLLYFPKGPTIRQRVSSPAARAAWSGSTFAPSHAAATSAKRRLKVQRFWAAAADFTRRKTELKADVLPAC